MSKQYSKAVRIYADKKMVLYFTDKEDERSYFERQANNALYWIEENFGGKKVKLNPVSILSYNLRSVVSYPEKSIIIALKQSSIKDKVDWFRYERYESIWGKEE